MTHPARPAAVALAATLATAALAPLASAQTLVGTRFLVGENQTIDADAQPIDLLANPATNAAGGFALRANANGTGVDGTSFIIASPAAGQPARPVAREATNTAVPGGFAQTNFSQAAISDGGTVAYSATGNIGGVTNRTRTGLFLANGTTTGADDAVLAFENGPATVTNLSPRFYGNSLTNAQFDAAGNLYVAASFRSAADPTGNGVDDSSAYLRGVGAGLNGATALLATGDTLAGPGGSLGTVSDVDTSFFRVSPSGGNYLGGAELAGAPQFGNEVVVLNGSALTTASGAVVREEVRVPDMDGGSNPDEVFRAFGDRAVNDAGKTVVQTRFGQAGVTATSTDSAILVDGVVAFRDGDSVDGVTLSLTGAPVALNGAGDVAFAQDGGALFLNGRLLLSAGDTVDTDGDGVPDSAFGGVTRTLGLTLGDRLVGAGPMGSDLVDLLVLGRAAGFGTDDLLLRVTAALPGATVIPEPTGLAAVALAGLTLLRRRRA